MNKWIVIILAVLLIGASACNQPAVSVVTENQSTPALPARTINVNDVWSDPGAYQGSIIVTGVVVSPGAQDPSTFTMIDVNEALACKETGCAGFYMPVQFHGQLPKGLDKVNVSGTLVNGVLIADTINVIGHLSLGG